MLSINIGGKKLTLTESQAVKLVNHENIEFIMVINSKKRVNVSFSFFGENKTASMAQMHWGEESIFLLKGSLSSLEDLLAKLKISTKQKKKKKK